MEPKVEEEKVERESSVRSINNVLDLLTQSFRSGDSSQSSDSSQPPDSGRRSPLSPELCEKMSSFLSPQQDKGDKTDKGDKKDSFTEQVIDEVKKLSPQLADMITSFSLLLSPQTNKSQEQINNVITNSLKKVSPELGDVLLSVLQSKYKDKSGTAGESGESAEKEKSEDGGDSRDSRDSGEKEKSEDAGDKKSEDAGGSGEKKKDQIGDWIKLVEQLVCAEKFFSGNTKRQEKVVPTPNPSSNQDICIYMIKQFTDFATKEQERIERREREKREKKDNRIKKVAQLITQITEEIGDGVVINIVQL